MELGLLVERLICLIVGYLFGTFRQLCFTGN